MSAAAPKLLLAAPRGYCAGVERAVEAVEKALELYGAPVYVRKEIVHNKHVVDQLRKRGAVFVESDQLVGLLHLAVLPRPVHVNVAGARRFSSCSRDNLTRRLRIGLTLEETNDRIQRDQEKNAMRQPAKEEFGI